MASSAIYNLFLCIGAFLVFLQHGNALKCQVGLCQNITDSSTNTTRYQCPHPMAEVTCPPLPGGLSADRCMTLRMKMRVSTYEIYSDDRNCSSHYACTKAVRDLACKNANTSGNLQSCEMDCCEGDNCNSDNKPVPITTKPTSAHGLECYVGVCLNFTGDLPPNVKRHQCTSPIKKVVCSNLPGGIKADRCLTIRMQMKMENEKRGTYEMHTDVRKCVSSFTCTKVVRDIACKKANVNDTLQKCDMGCCKGDLCNSGQGPLPTFAPEPTGPSGSDLSCYSCSNIRAIPGMGTANTPCSSPVKQTCGKVSSMLPGIKQDRCIRLSFKENGIKREMRNCSFAVPCNKEATCKALSTVPGLGSVSNCDVSCCFGKLCNTEQPASASGIPYANLLMSFFIVLISSLV